MQPRIKLSPQSAMCRSLRLTAVLAAAVVSALAVAPACAQTVTFGGPLVGGDVNQANGGIVTSASLLCVRSPDGLATDKLGRFYVTDSEGNGVYSFTWPAPGGSPECTQLNFSGLNTPGAIAVDGAGDVFVADYRNDRIVELTAAGSQKPIPVPQSGYPIGVAVDSSGNVYFSAGFAYNSPGAVFKLAAGATAPVQIGTGLSNPKGLAVDPAGNLFIADYSNQRIVQISASGTQTTALSLTNFPSLVAVDNHDDIFTDGSGNEYVIEVKAGHPDQVGVLPNPIPEFTGLTVDGNGNAFAVQGIAGDGAGPTFYQSSTAVIPLPQANVCQTGGNPASGCTSSVTLPFWIWSSVDLGTPRILTEGAAGLDFTQDTTQPGACTAGQITLAANQSASCNLVVDFTPQAAGPRRGAVQMVDSSGNVLVQLFLYGMGSGPQLSIAAAGAPGVTRTLPFTAPNTGLSAVSADAAGNLYVTDSFNGSSEIYEIAASGAQSTIPIANMYAPGRVELDGAGDLLIPGGDDDIEFPAAAGSPGASPVTLMGNLHGGTEGLALDGVGDADMVTDNFGLDTGAVYRATLDGSLLLVASATQNDALGDLVEDPGLSYVDTGGHFTAPIVADAANLLEASPIEQSFESFLDLQTLNANFTLPQGSGILSIGPNGDIYFEIGGSVYDTSGRSLTSAVAGSTSAFTVDAQANLYAIVTDGDAAPSVVEVPAIQQPFAFANTQAGSSSSAQAFTVRNSGNAAMTFSSVAVSGPFALDASTTTCSTSQPLEPAQTCAIGVVFSPTAAGAASGNLAVAVAGLVTPAFALTGTGTAAPVSTTTSLAASATTLVANQPLTLTATVTPASGATPQGSVTFQNGSATLGAASLNGSGVASLTINPAAGSYSIAAAYGGGTSWQSSVSSAVAVTVAPLPATSTALSISPNPASSGATVTFTATVTGATPTGSVTFSDGSSVLGTSSLSAAGVATYTSSTLSAGTHSITAAYTGDTNNAASVSSAATLTIAPISVQIAATTTSISPGASLSATVTVASVANYAGAVSLACAVSYQGSGTPTDAPACSVDPTSVNLTAGGSAPATITVTSTAASSSLAPFPGSAGARVLACGSGFGALLLLGLFRRRSRLAMLCGLLLVLVLPVIGCSPSPNQTGTTPQNPGTQAGTYTVTLSSTAGSVATTQSFTMTIQ